MKKIILITILFLSLFSFTEASMNVNQSLVGAGLNQGLVGWWTFDGKDLINNVVDRSGSGNTGYMQNFTSTSSAITVGKLGQGLNFGKNTTNFINVGNKLDALPIYTTSAWIRYNASQTNKAVLSKWSANQGYLIYIGGGGHTPLCYQNATSLSAVTVSRDRVWYHIACVYDGTNLSIYVNGKSDNTPVSVAAPITNSANFEIGRTGAGTIFNGSIDDARVYNRALSASEIKQLYNLGSARINQSIKGIDQGLVGWWTFDGNDLTNNVVDRSGKNNHGALKFATLGNVSTSSMQVAGKIGQGLEFDGQDDYINAQSPASLDDLPTLTVSAWIYPKSSGQGNSGFIIQKTTGFYVNGWGIRVDSGTTPGVLSPMIYVDFDGATDLQRIATAGQVVINKWTFLVVTWDGTTGNAHIYKNGNNELTYATNIDGAGNRLTDASNSLLIGGNTSVQSRNYDGYMDDVRVYNRVLSPSEITQLYNLGSARVNQSVSGIKSGLVGWWTFDGKDLINNVVDRSGSGNTGYLASSATNATSSQVVAGRIGQGLNFNATNRRINTGANTVIGVGDASVCLWVKSAFATAPATGNLIFQTSGFIMAVSTVNRFYISNTGGSSTKLSAINAFVYNKWRFFCATRDSTGLSTLYVDGVVNAAASATASPTAGSNFNIGNNQTGTTGNFTGSIDDVRVYNRVLSASEIQQLYNNGK